MDSWTVQLAISGPIELPRSTLRLRVLKGDLFPFETEAVLKARAHGVHVSLVVQADTRNSANDAAVYFVGRAIDVLCLQVDAPLHVSVSGPQFRQSDDHIKRVIDEEGWLTCFEEGRQFGGFRSTYSRALSWFRKGRTSEDPVDKFLAFWTSVEVVGSRFARDNERTQAGVINKICDCLDQLWGAADSWKVIANDADFINQCNERRNQITHGTIPLVDLTSIRNISNSIPMLHDLAREFLRDWKESHDTREFAT